MANEYSSYVISFKAGKPVSIEHLLCGKVSYHPLDIQHHYCGHCHMFMDLFSGDERLVQRMLQEAVNWPKDDDDDDDDE